jgi:hypothetical protein
MRRWRGEQKEPMPIEDTTCLLQKSKNAGACAAPCSALCGRCEYWHKNRWKNRDYGTCEILCADNGLGWSTNERVQTSANFGCKLFAEKK